MSWVALCVVLSVLVVFGDEEDSAATLSEFERELAARYDPPVLGGDARHLKGAIQTLATLPPSHPLHMTKEALVRARDGEAEGERVLEEEIRRWEEARQQGKAKWAAMRREEPARFQTFAEQRAVRADQVANSHRDADRLPRGLRSAVQHWHTHQSSSRWRGDARTADSGPPLVPTSMFNVQDTTDPKPTLSHKLSCKGSLHCRALLQERDTSFLETGSELFLTDTNEDVYKANCDCGGNPALECSQHCTCTPIQQRSDGVIFGVSFLETGDDYLNNGQPPPEELDFTEHQCGEDGRWCLRAEDCCDDCTCTMDQICDCPRRDLEPVKAIRREPAPPTGRDMTLAGIQTDPGEHSTTSKRLLAADTQPVGGDQMQIRCSCTQHDCLFNSTCNCRRPDEWETWRCALMGFRGRSIKLDGRKQQYLQFIRPPLTCTEFTLEFWTKPGPNVRTWSRFFDVGGGRHRWFMVTPKGSGWWGMASVWRYWWYWNWVRTESLPENMWSHVAVLFGYWHVCLLVNGQYRYCRWNHWRVRNAWRYYHRWRNWIGKSQYWWDPYLSAQMDELRIWCGYRSGYWINKYMYRRLEHKPWNLIGLWRFNEQSGIWAHDESHRQNHMLLRRAGDWKVLSWGVAPKKNEDLRYPQFVVSDVPVFHKVYLCPKDLPIPKPRYSINFGGAQYQPAYLYMPKEMMLKLNPAFTIEGWVRIPSSVRDHWMRWFDVGMGDWWPWRNILLSLGRPGVRPMFFGARHPSVSRHYQAAIAAPCPRNRWVHVAAVHTGSQASIIINGRKVASASMGTTTGKVCGTHNFIGKSAYPWDSYFGGQMDDMRFWNYARSETEINLQRYVPLLGSEPGLVAYYSFAEGAGSRAMDQTANHYDLTMIGNVGYLRSTSPIKPLF